MSSLSKQSSTGTRYTATVALMLAGLVVSPLALYFSQPFGYVMALLATAFTLSCLMVAWFQWKQRSRLTIPSLPLRFRTSGALKTLILCSIVSASVSHAGDLASYRGLEFGSSVAVVSKQAGVQPTDVKVVYEKPAVIQTIDWQPRYISRADGKKDSVREGTLSFLNGQLYRIVVIYDRYQLEGMTSDDVVAALSKSYGVASTPKVQVPFHSPYGETAPVLARWEDGKSVYDLVPTEDKASFALLMSSKTLNAAADTAILESLRLEGLAAPQRAKDLEQKRLDEDRLALEKARTTNKPNFIP